jgi:hypothetical protein
MVLTVSFGLSPVTGLVATVACGYFRKLDASVGASGPHDFAVRCNITRQLMSPHPLHPASNVRDDREAPLLWARDGSM